jgi:hypothetical protein
MLQFSPYEAKETVKIGKFDGILWNLVSKSSETGQVELLQKRPRVRDTMMKKLYLVLLPLFVSSAHAAYVANRDFLSVGQGARANGMGEAFVAVADNSSAIYWNPAGLTQMKSDEFTTTYADRFDGLAKEAVLHYAHRGRRGMWGFGYAGSFVNNIPITTSLTEDDITAINAGTFAPSTSGEKSVNENAFLFSYSRPLSPESRHSLGATVKLIYKDYLSMVHGYGTAVDMGYHYKTESEVWRFGANLQNAVSLVSYTGTIKNLDVKATATESYLPNIKTGVAFAPPWRVLNGRLLVAADIDMLTSFDMEDYRLGAEYAFGENVALRAGKIFGRQDEGGEDYTLGMGIKLKNLMLDFSFLSNEIGQTIRGTIGYRLGGDYYTPNKY